jgi:tRNA nucleotidyltransferase (CCA-adding enzyme)
MYLSDLQGRDIVSILSMPKPGAWTGDVLAKVMEWQLDHPEGTKDECSAWLKEEHSAGRIPTDSPKSIPEKNAVEGPSSSSKRTKTK